MKDITNLIIDCDTGEDDALAILLALKNNLPLKYIISSYGNTNVSNASQNSADLIQLADNKSVKVIRGSEHALEEHPFEEQGVTAGDFVGKNGLCNTVLPHASKGSIISPHQFEDEVAQILKRDGPFDYIVTGPMTNLARLCLTLGTEITQYIKKVYVMGGSLTTPGNSGPINPQTNQPYAEFNFYCDAKAVDVVLNTQLPLTLVSWDLTSEMTIPYQDISRLSASTPIGTFCIELMTNFFSYYGLSHDRNFELNDPLTIIAYLNYGHREKKKIKVIQLGQEYGRSIIAQSGREISHFMLNKQERSRVIKKILNDLEITQS